MEELYKELYDNECQHADIKRRIKLLKRKKCEVEGVKTPPKKVVADPKPVKAQPIDDPFPVRAYVPLSKREVEEKYNDGYYSLD